MYLLDTDTYSNLLRGSESIRQRVSQAPPRTVYLCAITPEEMLRGRLDAINQVRTRQEARLPKAYDYLVDLIRSLNRASILRYDDDAVQIFRDFPASIKRAGSQDCRIAAVALANGYTIVTSNTAHFAKIGVITEDWNLSPEA
ncbi:MAG: type II toxin-antitoxin system VapC family toxin [Janthinobacterium lividum]